MSAEPDELDGFEEPDGRKRVEFDGWGRYKLPHPDSPDKEVAWTRVTTLAGTLEDRWNLERWGKRKVLEGIVIDKGLVSQAAEVFTEYGWDPDVKEAKDRLDKLANMAIDKAGAHKGADVGTELHSLTEGMNQGTLLFDTEAPEHLRENLRVYSNTLVQYGITVVPEYMERLICVPDLNTVGRLDNLVRVHGSELLQVFDLKSQKTMDFGAMKIAIQLAIYANGYAMFNEETWSWEEMPPVDKVVATVCHLPVLAEYEDKACHMYDVDLEWGWRWAKASFQTRKARNAKPLTPKKAAARRPATVSSGRVTASPTPGAGSALVEAIKAELSNGPAVGLDWAAMFRQAKSLDELTRAGEECVKAGAMTEELKKLGKTRRAELAG